MVLQQRAVSIARAGGDKVTGAVVDGVMTVLVVIPGILLLAYGVLKLTDFVKIITAQLWLKKEKWVKKLTVRAA